MTTTQYEPTFLNAPDCLVCKGQRPAMDTCNYCRGTGVFCNVGWARTPWSEIIPNLWIGGHDYAASGWGFADLVTREELAEAGFEVVVSMYETDCHPPEDVEHHTMVVADDIRRGIDADEIKEAWRLSGIVADSVAGGRKTLSRCQAGLNRSSLVAALAMVRMGYHPQRAIDLIRERREPFALFNPHFVQIILAQTPREAPDGATA